MFENFNSDQESIIVQTDGPRCVISGPGTGKTKTMVGFVKHLIEDLGIPVSAIRGTTFSKEGAETLAKRSGIKGVFSTFHSLGYAIASEIIHKPVEPELRHRLMFKLVRRWKVDYKELDQFIASMRRQRITPADAAISGEYAYNKASAYIEYEAERADGGWMDFDSMLVDGVDALEKNAEARRRWQLQYLIVDEAQDTDNLQWRMAQLLTEKFGNITVVGDPGQAIYGFRGAMPENITNFEQWFPGGRYFYLGRNYRSTSCIVNFVRENTPSGTPKELTDRMIAHRTESGARIAIKMYWTDDAEAESALKLATANPLHSIILARTNRGIALLERLATRNNIRYHLLGESGFWKQNEVRKAVEALKLYPLMTTAAAMDMALPPIESRYEVDDRTDKDNDALENLKTIREIGKEHRMAKDFVIHANKMMHRRNDARGVTFSTIHQAKGGEWTNVFLIGAKAGLIPHKDGDALEEERIYYVAISRAVDFLRVSFAGTPSKFLRKYLTEEILDKLREKADEVEHLQEQTKLFV